MRPIRSPTGAFSDASCSGPRTRLRLFYRTSGPAPALVLKLLRGPPYELLDGFVACPDQGAHAAFRVGSLCRALHAEAALRGQAAVPHDRGPEAHPRLALSWSLEYLDEFVQIDAQCVLGARVVARLDDAAARSDQLAAQAIRKQLRWRRDPAAVRIGVRARGVLVREAVIDERRIQPGRSADVVDEQGVAQVCCLPPLGRGTKIVIRGHRSRWRRHAAPGAGENQRERGDSPGPPQHCFTVIRP